MIAFMLFIVAMVVYMFKIHGNDALVDEDYYEKSINYDQEFKAVQNMYTDQAEPQLMYTKSQVIIKLKQHANYEMELMRPSTNRDNIKVSGSTIGDHNLILIDRNTMPTGVWFLELKWVVNGKVYLFKTRLKL